MSEISEKSSKGFWWQNLQKYSLVLKHGKNSFVNYINCLWKNVSIVSTNINFTLCENTIENCCIMHTLFVTTLFDYNRNWMIYFSYGIMKIFEYTVIVSLMTLTETGSKTYSSKTWRKNSTTIWELLYLKKLYFMEISVTPRVATNVSITRKR